MGIAKPHEAEIGVLGPAPGPPVEKRVASRVRDLVRATSGGIEIAGHPLRIPGLEAEDTAARDRVVERVRLMLGHRILSRRPNADAAAFALLFRVVRGTVAGHTVFDRELMQALVQAIDGL